VSTTPAAADVTRLLIDWSGGDAPAAERLMPVVYAEFRHAYTP
jgi:hypothetical protein